jgi:primase-polymerase (primpol)-like protein
MTSIQLTNAGDSPVRFLTPDWNAIPQPLRHLPFALWRAEPELGTDGQPKHKANGNPKFKKAPRNAVGYNISKSKPEQWLSFEIAMAAFHPEKFTGVGVMLQASSGLVGIDLDDVADLLIIKPALQAILAKAKQERIYCEQSPSGTGLRLFVCGQLPGNDGRRQAGIELYADAAFLTVTGITHWPGEVKRAQWLVDELLKLITEPSQGRSSTLAVTQAGISSTDGELVAALSSWAADRLPRLWQGRWNELPQSPQDKIYPSQSEADMALIGHLAREAHRRGLQEKSLITSTAWEAFRKSGLYRQEKELQVTEYAIPKAIESVFSSAACNGISLLDETHGDVLNGKAFAKIWRNKFLFVASAGKWLRWQED